MKYELYTLPVREAYEKECECPLCFLADKMEKQNIQFFLGGSVMQPVVRKQVNEQGFCPEHFRKLFRQGEKLTVSILANSHLLELRKKMLKSEQKLLKELKKRGAKDRLASYASFLEEQNASCALCSKTERALKRFAFTIVYLWKKDEEFCRLLQNSRGFCYPHLPFLIRMAEEVLSGKKLESFLETLFALQEKNGERLSLEIDWFIQKFDYRNKDAPWKSSQDSPGRVIQKLIGRVKDEEWQ